MSAKPVGKVRSRVRRVAANARVKLSQYSQLQLSYAQVTVNECVRQELPRRAAVIAVETEMTESGILMYANGYNDESLTYPHDVVGYDHGSVNSFQQQVGGAPNSTANWGTTAQLMNHLTSVRLFLQALTRFDWQSMTNWDAAQKVQGSFDPTGGNYRKNDARAQALVAQLWPAPTVEDDDVKQLNQYTGTDVKHHDAVYLTDGLQQRWMGTGNVRLPAAQSLLKKWGQDAAVHATDNPRDSYGEVIGLDPETSA